MTTGKQFKAFSINDVPEEGKLPDGVYNFKIRSSKKYSKTPGKETAIINLSVTEGSFTGQEISLFADYRNPANDEKSIKALGRGLKLLRSIVTAIGLEGFDAPEDLIGGKFSAKVTNNGDFLNLSQYTGLGNAVKETRPAAAPVTGTGRFASRSRAAETVEEGTSEQEISEDDIPFK